MSNPAKIMGGFCLLVLTTFFGCEKDPTLLKGKYIYISHSRNSDHEPESMMEVVKNLDVGGYDVVMLGGDMHINTSKSPETLQLLDRIFDLECPSTLWSLGNHDYADTSLICNHPATYMLPAT